MALVWSVYVPKYPPPKSPLKGLALMLSPPRGQAKLKAGRAPTADLTWPPAPGGQKTSGLKPLNHPSSWELKLLPKMWKPIERKRNISIDTGAGLDLHVREWPWGHLSSCDGKLPPAIRLFWTSTVQPSHTNLQVRLWHPPLTRHIDVDVLPFHFPILHLSVVIIANIQARMSGWGISDFEHCHEEAAVVFFMSNVYPVTSLGHWVLPAHFAVSRAFEREIGIQLYHHFIPIGNNSRQRKLAKC